MSTFFDISVGINSLATASFDDGANDGSAFSCTCIVYEEPVLCSKSSWLVLASVA